MKTRIFTGKVSWRGQDISKLPPHRRAANGIGWAAQEREIFPSLTVAENLTVTCPLLFVREGMDITTLVLWEKSLANAPDKTTPSRTSSAATTVAKAKPELAVAKKADTNEYQIKYPTLLRKDPNFSSTAITSLSIGSRVTIESRAGDWLEVRGTANGPKGFIRKEFIKPIEVAGK